jgi:hypothetical protein
MQRKMAPIISVVVCLAAVPLFAEQQLTYSELLQVLRIHTWTVRVPTIAGQHWTVTALGARELRPVGKNPAGLTPTPERLVALREAGQDKLEYTLWESQDVTQGVEDLCKLGASCGAPYELHWNKSPEYSADGEQCVLGQIVNKSNPDAKAFIVLVRAGRTK